MQTVLFLQSKMYIVFCPATLLRVHASLLRARASLLRALVFLLRVCTPTEGRGTPSEDMCLSEGFPKEGTGVLAAGIIVIIDTTLIIYVLFWSTKVLAALRFCLPYASNALLLCHSFHISQPYATGLHLC